MRTKFQPIREATEEERVFVEVMEKYKVSTIQGLCLVVFGKEHTPQLERKLRYIRERYHNFLLKDIVPIGRIIKTKTNHKRDAYKLVLDSDVERHRIQLNIELDLVCAAIEKYNTRRIWGELQLQGQIDLGDYETLLSYRTELENELKGLE